MASRLHSAHRILAVIALALVLLVTSGSAMPPLKAQDSASSPVADPSNSQNTSTAATPVLPRGKKLVLKDGSFHLVREYHVEGGRVRYYSIERSQWEEIPAELVDWDATKKVAADEAQHDAAVVAKVHTQEAARIVQPLDIDASLEVAPGIFLPPGDRLFVFDGKTIVPLAQAETTSKLAKGHLLEQVLVPVPIISTRYSVSIQGTHAKLRVQSGQPEFYMRTADAREPQMELIRTKTHGESRQIENLDELFGEKRATRDALPMQRWDVAPGVYRYTLGQPLAAGEYAFAEIVQDENMSVYVWDFGVDGSPAPAAPKIK
jgi:hypothetical protein